MKQLFSEITPLPRKLCRIFTKELHFSDCGS